jgi:hypothetical protein
MLPYTAAAQADVKRRSCTCSFPSPGRAEQQSLRSDSELDGLGSQPGGGPNSVSVPRIRIRQAVQTPRIEHLHEAGEEMRACLSSSSLPAGTRNYGDNIRVGVA